MFKTCTVVFSPFLCFSIKNSNWWKTLNFLWRVNNQKIIMMWSWYAGNRLQLLPMSEKCPIPIQGAILNFKALVHTNEKLMSVLSTNSPNLYLHTDNQYEKVIQSHHNRLNVSVSCVTFELWHINASQNHEMKQYKLPLEWPGQIVWRGLWSVWAEVGQQWPTFGAWSSWSSWSP